MASAGKFSTLKSQVSLGSGQHLGFQKGKGYYASSQAPVDPDVTTARQQVAAQIAAALAPLKTQETQAHTQSLQTGDQIDGFTKAYAQLLSQIAPQTQQTFQNAGDSQATYAKGYSGQVGADASAGAAALNAYLAKVGGSGTVADNGAALGNVTYGLGGAIPATQFADQGAAFTAAAKQLPAEAVGQGQAALAANAANWAKTAQDYASQTAAVTAKEPSLVQSALSSLKSLELRQQAYNLAAQRTIGTDTGTYVDPATGAVTPKVGYHTDPTTGKVIKDGTTVDPKTGQVVSVSTLTKAQTARQKAVGKRDTSHANAFSYLDKYFEGKTGSAPIGYKPETTGKTKLPNGVTVTNYLRRDGSTTTNAADPSIVKQPIYEKGQKASALPVKTKAMAFAVSYLQAQLGRYGYSAAKIRQMAQQILAPYYPAAPKPVPVTPIQNLDRPGLGVTSPFRIARP